MIRFGSQTTGNLCNNGDAEFAIPDVRRRPRAMAIKGDDELLSPSNREQSMRPSIKENETTRATAALALAEALGEQL